MERRGADAAFPSVTTGLTGTRLPRERRSPPPGFALEKGRDIHVCFVNRHLFHQRPRGCDNPHDFAGLLLVSLHPWPDKDALGTKPAGGGAGQSRTHPELSRLVTGGADDPALCWRGTNDHRPATQCRVVTLLHGGVERIHVEVEDDTEHARFSSVIALSAILRYDVSFNQPRSQSSR